MQNENTSIVISGYFEQENKRELLEGVRRSMELLGAVFEIIVVDDNSADEWWKGGPEFPEKFSVRAIRTPKERGLAKAIMDGIKASSYNVIVVISGNAAPEKIPELISRVQDGADIVIASPCLNSEGSGDYGVLRRIILAGADLFTRTLFRELRDITDVDSNFFAMRKDVVTHANLHPSGDNLLLEILVQGEYNSVSEVRDQTNKRNAGVTKAGSKNAAYTLRHISSLFWRSGEFHRFLKFCAVGGVGAILNLVVLYSLTELGVFYLISGLLGMEAGLLSNFFLNRSWTFKDRQGRGLSYVLTALYRDHAVRFVGIVLNLLILWILTSFFGLYYLLSQLIGIGVAMLWNYGGNQWWTWEAA
ncbi:MAG: GtrA family protein [Euryarchaeota archaeon]|nr:GtrA family protein [Euryarchaeota archaeon]